jgi:hypothetical protein
MTARTQCPHCGQTLPTTRLGMVMSPLKAKIFDAVARAGVNGIPCHALYELIFVGRNSSRETLKAHIWQINELIADEGRRIVSDRELYRLVEISCPGIVDS